MKDQGTFPVPEYLHSLEVDIRLELVIIFCPPFPVPGLSPPPGGCTPPHRQLVRLWLADKVRIMAGLRILPMSIPRPSGHLIVPDIHMASSAVEAAYTESSERATPGDVDMISQSSVPFKPLYRVRTNLANLMFPSPRIFGARQNVFRPAQV